MCIQYTLYRAGDVTQNWWCDAAVRARARTRPAACIIRNYGTELFECILIFLVWWHHQTSYIQVYVTESWKWHGWSRWRRRWYHNRLQGYGSVAIRTHNHNWTTIEGVGRAQFLNSNFFGSPMPKVYPVSKRTFSVLSPWRFRVKDWNQAPKLPHPRVFLGCKCFFLTRKNKRVLCLTFFWRVLHYLNCTESRDCHALVS